MAFELRLDEKTRIAFTRVWGELTDDDTRAHLVKISTLFRQGTLDSTWAQLVDFSDVSEMSVSSSVVSQAARENPWPRGSLRVFIVPRDVQYGLVRMYQMMGDPKTEKIVLVKSRAEAIEHIASAAGQWGGGA